MKTFLAWVAAQLRRPVVIAAAAVVALGSVLIATASPDPNQGNLINYTVTGALAKWGNGLAALAFAILCAWAVNQARVFYAEHFNGEESDDPLAYGLVAGAIWLGCLWLAGQIFG